jgi:hypothetical protein
MKGKLIGMCALLVLVEIANMPTSNQILCCSWSFAFNFNSREDVRIMRLNLGISFVEMSGSSIKTMTDSIKATWRDEMFEIYVTPAHIVLSTA